MGGEGIEPPTLSVSRRRSTAELAARLRGGFHIVPGRKCKTKPMLGSAEGGKVPSSALANQFSALLRPSPTRNRAVLEAGRMTASPVRGLRAAPAARFTVTKLPNPSSQTSAQAFKDWVTAAIKASRSPLA